MVYIPSKLPAGISDDEGTLAAYLEDELQRISSSLISDIIAFDLAPAHAAPLRPRSGMIVYADGTDWNPGSGEGLYVRTIAGAWQFVPPPPAASVTSIAGNTGAFTLNGTSGITNTVNDIKISQATAAQFGAVKVDNTSMTAAAGVISTARAVKADEVAATSNVLAVTPSVQQNHPSAIKAWVDFTVSGTTVTVQANYNVSGVVRNGTGDYTVSFTTAFADANYVVVGIANANTAANAQLVVNIYATAASGTGIDKTTAHVRILVANASSGGPTDQGQVNLMFAGNQ